MNPVEWASLSLSTSQMRALRRFGASHAVQPGEVLFSAGDADQDLIVVESGEVEVSRPATSDSAEAIINSHGPHRFVGELNLLTGQTAYLTARVRRAGTVRRIPRQDFWRLMHEETELSDIILKVFMARRDLLRVGEGARSIQVIGSRWSSSSLSLRNWLARQQVPHTWFDVDDAAGQVLAAAVGAAGADVPVVITPTAVLRRATAGALAAHLGLDHRDPSGRVRDLVVIGAGPAGLGAAVCGASEGLDTLLLDGVSVGGQAAASSRIENYVGFPSGVAGADLAGRALIQAQKFGADVSTPCAARAVRGGSGTLAVELDGGGLVHTKAVVIATGAAYRTLPLAGWGRFEGVSIQYAATEIEARACTGQPVVVVGGANSAGQAAIFLGDRGCHVTLVARGGDLGSSMSQYLTARLEAHRTVDLVTDSDVTALHGTATLEAVSVTNHRTGMQSTVKCRRLFCFIGATPATSFLGGAVALDDHGFVATGRDVLSSGLDPAWTILNRAPLGYETSIPSVFAVGDVRSGSVKRVAAAVGEGSAAVGSVHAAIRASGPALR